MKMDFEPQDQMPKHGSGYGKYAELVRAFLESGRRYAKITGEGESQNALIMGSRHAIGQLNQSERLKVRMRGTEVWYELLG